MAAVQMNVRIDGDVKARGDAVFAELGYSPSEAARALWGFAARNKRRPKKVRDLMDELRDSAGEAAGREGGACEHADVLEWLERGDDAIQRFFDEVGAKRGIRAVPSPEEQDEMIADSLEEDARCVASGLSWGGGALAAVGGGA